MLLSGIGYEVSGTTCHIDGDSYFVCISVYCQCETVAKRPEGGKETLSCHERDTIEETVHQHASG